MMEGHAWLDFHTGESEVVNPESDVYQEIDLKEVL